MATTENLIPPGRYTARGVTAELGETKSGKEQVGVLMQILEDGPWAGHQMNWYGYFTDKSRERTLESLMLLGWDGDSLENLAGIDRNEVSLTIEHEPVQNEKGEVVKDEHGQPKIRARAAWINRPGGLAITPMDPNKKRAFAASMKGAVAAIKAKAATGAASGARPATKPPSASSASPARPYQGVGQPQHATAQSAMGVNPDDIPF